MATIYEMDLGNIFVGDPTPGNSLFTQIKSFKFPSLTVVTKEHKPAGSPLAAKFPMKSLEALELTFKCSGFNPTLSGHFGIGASLVNKFSVLGNVRDLATGEEYSARAMIRGFITKIDASEYSAGEGIEHDYTVEGVTHYEMYFDERQKYYLNLFEGPAGVKIDGVPVMLTAARNIGLI